MDSKQARQAARVLRDVAPVQSHEIRRACITAAATLEQRGKEIDVQERKVRGTSAVDTEQGPS